MKTYRFTLRPVSAFGTPLMGDTLLGSYAGRFIIDFQKKNW